MTISAGNPSLDPRRNLERTGVRQLSFNDWHRHAFEHYPDRPWMPAIDFDLVGYCSRCSQPVYIFEAVRGPGEKPTTVIRKTADSIGNGCAAILVHYKTIGNSTDVRAPLESLQWTQVHPFAGRPDQGTTDSLPDHLRLLAGQHRCAW